MLDNFQKSRQKYLYYFALTIYLLAKYIEISTLYYTNTYISNGMRVLRLASYLIVVVVLLFYTEYTKSELVRLIPVIICVSAVTYIAHSVTILACFLFVFAAKDIQRDEVLRFVVALQIAITILIVIGCLLGQVPDWTYNVGGRYRHSLGFFYPNRISSIYFFITLTLCYLAKERLNLLWLLILEAGNYTVFYYTNSRMSFLMTTLSLIIFFAISLEMKSKRRIVISDEVYIIAVISIPLICILACYFYDPANAILSKINSIVSNRLIMGYNALHSKALTLFGQNNEWIGFGGLGYLYLELPNEYNTVDCAFVKILLDNGIVMLFLIVTGYAMSIKQETKKGDRYIGVTVLMLFIYCIMEPPLIEIGINPFVFLLSALIV